MGDVHIGLSPYAMLLNPVGVTKKADAFASTLCLFVYMHGSCCHVPTCQRTRMSGTCPLASTEHVCEAGAAVQVTEEIGFEVEHFQIDIHLICHAL